MQEATNDHFIFLPLVFRTPSSPQWLLLSLLSGSSHLSDLKQDSSRAQSRLSVLRLQFLLGHLSLIYVDDVQMHIPALICPHAHILLPAQHFYLHVW